MTNFKQPNQFYYNDIKYNKHNKYNKYNNYNKCNK